VLPHAIGERVVDVHQVPLLVFVIPFDDRADVPRELDGEGLAIVLVGRLLVALRRFQNAFGSRQAAHGGEPLDQERLEIALALGGIAAEPANTLRELRHVALVIAAKCPELVPHRAVFDVLDRLRVRVHRIDVELHEGFERFHGFFFHCRSPSA
jgi:hypothetical protein